MGVLCRNKDGDIFLINVSCHKKDIFFTPYQWYNKKKTLSCNGIKEGVNCWNGRENDRYVRPY